MPDERRAGFAYPTWSLDESDPKRLERRAASEKAYAEAIAAGLSEKAARIEAARADAMTVRVQAGLPAEDPDDARYEVRRRPGLKKRNPGRK